MKKICISCIRFYQKNLSKLKGKACCKYYPTCSEYSIRAFETHGFFKGASLSFWRILRCNPWSAGGVDYVPSTPERKRWEEQQKNRTDSTKFEN